MRVFSLDILVFLFQFYCLADTYITAHAAAGEQPDVRDVSNIAGNKTSEYNRNNIDHWIPRYWIIDSNSINSESKGSGIKTKSRNNTNSITKYHYTKNSNDPIGNKASRPILNETTILRSKRSDNSDAISSYINSTYCARKESCRSRSGTDSLGGSVSCFCDQLCHLYEDCCSDLVAQFNTSHVQVNRDSHSNPPDSQLPNPVHGSLSRSAVSCQYFEDLIPWQEQNPDTAEQLHRQVLEQQNSAWQQKEQINRLQQSISAELWMVNKCPSGSENGYWSTKCEWPKYGITNHTDAFYNIPVYGNVSRILYRNVFCAICHSAMDYVFWDVVQTCGDQVMESQEPLEVIARHTATFPDLYRPQCSLRLAPPKRETFRPCLRHIGRCDRRWKDRAIIRRCRQYTSYVFAGETAFKNRDCAMCNFVNETYLRCEDTREPSKRGDYFHNNHGNIPQSVEEISDDNESAKDSHFKISIGDGLTTVWYFINHGGKAAISTTDTKFWKSFLFPICDSGSIYDPFSKSCQRLHCEMDGEPNPEGRCLSMKKPPDYYTSSTETLSNTRGPGTGRKPYLRETASLYAVPEKDGSINNDDAKKDKSYRRDKELPIDEGVAADLDDNMKKHSQTINTSLARAEGDKNNDLKDKYQTPCPGASEVAQDDFAIGEDGQVFIKSTNKLLQSNEYVIHEGSIYTCGTPSGDVIFTTRGSVYNDAAFRDQDFADMMQKDSGIISSRSRIFKSNDLFVLLQYSSTWQRLLAISSSVLLILCLLIALSICIVSQDQRRDVYGKACMCLLISLALVHSLQLVLMIISTFQNLHPLLCLCLSALLHFSWLAVLFWLNVMTLTVFKSLLRIHLKKKTFSTAPESSITSNETSDCCSGFLLYSLYGWVCPLALSAAAVCLTTFTPDSSSIQQATSCWAMNLNPLLLVLVPVALLLTANLTMCAVVFCKILLRPRARVGPREAGQVAAPPEGDSELDGLEDTLIRRSIKFEQEQRIEASKKRRLLMESRYSACFHLTLLFILSNSFLTLILFTGWTSVYYVFLGFHVSGTLLAGVGVVCRGRLRTLFKPHRERSCQVTGVFGVDHPRNKSGGNYCTLEREGSTVYLRDTENRIIVRETSI